MFVKKPDSAFKQDGCHNVIPPGYYTAQDCLITPISTNTDRKQCRKSVISSLFIAPILASLNVSSEFNFPGYIVNPFSYSLSCRILKLKCGSCGSSTVNRIWDSHSGCRRNLKPSSCSPARRTCQFSVYRLYLR